MSKTVLVISDTQAPFHHPDTVKFLSAVKRKYKPTRVIHIGDLVDAYCFSEYLKAPESISAEREIRGGKKFVADLARVFPKVDVIFGNHDRRLHRAAKRAGIHKSFIKAWSDVLEAPRGWKWYNELEVDNVLYQHGDESGAGGLHAAQRRAILNGRNTVAGHLHTNASIMYFANRNGLWWGMHVGSLIDHKAVAFEYSKKALKKPILSVGVIQDGVPQIVPMKLTKKGRWTGRI